MPGFEFPRRTETVQSSAVTTTYFPAVPGAFPAQPSADVTEALEATHLHEERAEERKDAPYYENGVYHNPRLDAKNYLEGPLSWNPSTRLRQMLARPGIVVCSI